MLLSLINSPSENGPSGVNSNRLGHSGVLRLFIFLFLRFWNFGGRNLRNELLQQKVKNFPYCEKFVGKFPRTFPADSHLSAMLNSEQFILVHNIINNKMNPVPLLQLHRQTAGRNVREKLCQTCHNRNVPGNRCCNMCDACANNVVSCQCRKKLLYGYCVECKGRKPEDTDYYCPRCKDTMVKKQNREIKCNLT